MIAEQAQRLESFLAAMADGVIDESELQAQEARLVKLMKEVEPLLDDELHAKVTRAAVRADGLRPDADVALDAAGAAEDRVPR